MYYIEYLPGTIARVIHVDLYENAPLPKACYAQSTDQNKLSLIITKFNDWLAGRAFKHAIDANYAQSVPTKELKLKNLIQELL